MTRDHCSPGLLAVSPVLIPRSVCCPSCLPGSNFTFGSSVFHSCRPFLSSEKVKVTKQKVSAGSRHILFPPQDLSLCPALEHRALPVTRTWLSAPFPAAWDMERSSSHLLTLMYMHPSFNNASATHWQSTTLIHSKLHTHIIIPNHRLSVSSP